MRMHPMTVTKRPSPDIHCGRAFCRYVILGSPCGREFILRSAKQKVCSIHSSAQRVSAQRERSRVNRQAKAKRRANGQTQPV